MLQFIQIPNSIAGTIQLPTSKSISNRALILNFFLNEQLEIKNLSKANDTKVLQEALLKFKNNSSIIDLEDAGTAFRFLTALAAFFSKNELVLTGSHRMLQRPIGPLVQALNQIGASITYLQHEGYPPIKVLAGKKNTSSKVSVPATMSSQFISALMLIAPFLDDGLEIKLSTPSTSTSYIYLTQFILESIGIQCRIEFPTIYIAHYLPLSDIKKTIEIESDWSAAGYWYSLVGTFGGKLCLENTSIISAQGDAHLATIFKKLGVETKQEGNQLIITNAPYSKQTININFTDIPDAAQTIIVYCAVHGISGTFTGLHTLRIKETDRLLALQKELKKINCLFYERDDYWELDSTNVNFPEAIEIATYNDHRMAMAFSILSKKVKNLMIANELVVEKSYPHFWNDLKNCGFIFNIEHGR